MECNKETMEEIIKRIEKATDKKDAMPKQKHIRWSILEIYKIGTSEPLWSAMKQLQTKQHNPVTVYKTLFLINKMLVDGPGPIVQEAIQKEQFIEGYASGLGWSSYTSAIESYLVYLCTKLEFHRTHTQFNGNFDYEEYLSLRGVCDLQAGYVLIDDLLCYYENIDRFQATLFSSEHQTELLLTPLLPLIEESHGLYLFLVSMLTAMFVSIDEAETLATLSDGFCSLFDSLKSFYRRCSVTPTIKEMAEIPVLPEKAPSFLEIRENFFKTDSREPGEAGEHIKAKAQQEREPGAPYEQEMAQRLQGIELGANRLQGELSEDLFETKETTATHTITEKHRPAAEIEDDLPQDLFQIPSLEEYHKEKKKELHARVPQTREAAETKELREKVERLERELEKEKTQRKRLLVLCMEQKQMLEKMKGKIKTEQRERENAQLFEQKSQQRVEALIKKNEETIRELEKEKRKTEKLARAYKELRAEYVESVSSQNTYEIDELKEELQKEKEKRQKLQERVLGKEDTFHSMLEGKEQQLETLRKQLETLQARADSADEPQQKLQSMAEEMQELVLVFDAKKQKYYEGIGDVFGELFRTTPGLIERMGAITFLLTELVQLAAEEQKEIERTGKAGGDVGGFYKKHHRWTEGLFSAAKQIVADTERLLELSAVDAPPEKAIVMCSRVNASISQLLSAARVKADTDAPLHGKLEQTAARIQHMAREFVEGIRKNAVEIFVDEEAVQKMTETEFTTKMYELKEEAEKMDRELAQKREEIARMTSCGYHEEFN